MVLAQRIVAKDIGCLNSVSRENLFTVLAMLRYIALGGTPIIVVPWLDPTPIVAMMAGHIALHVFYLLQK